MDFQTIAIALMIIGLVLIIIEALSPGFFVVIFGAILLAVGILGYFIEDFFSSYYLPATVIIVAIVTTIATIKAYQMLARPVPPETTVTESMIGKTGVVTVMIDPINIRGKVRIGNDIWSATSDYVIEEGTKVEVYAGEGVHVKVRPKNL